MPFRKPIPFALLLTLLFTAVIGCTRRPLRDRNHALRPAAHAPDLDDDLDVKPLVEAIQTEIQTLQKSPPDFTLQFGQRVIAKSDYMKALQLLVDAAGTSGDKDALLDEIRFHFDFYEVYGTDGWGNILLTSYYEPELLGSLHRTSKFTQALYSPPDDLVDVMLKEFDDKFADLAPMRGRLIETDGKQRLVPFYSREQIDGKGALKGEGLELAWTDPIDAFFMQIQGSGTIVLEDGRRLRLGYADQNGLRYEAVGKFMLDHIPKDKMTAQGVEQYLRGLPESRARVLLYRNPSYVFFQKNDGDPTTAFGTPVVDGRTIAVDSRFFPKGALAFLQFQKPVFPNLESYDPSGWEPESRLVLDQDTGGAIRGGGRVDLFWGSGPEAKRYAGAIHQKARFYYLAPKAEDAESAPASH